MNFLFWSPSMSLSMFLGIVLIIALVVLVAFRFIRRSVIGYTFVSAILLLLAMLSFWVIRSYTFPSGDRQVFNNVDYHLFEHLGFEFQNNLLLVDTMQIDRSLWDGKEGKVTFLKDSSDQEIIQMESFFEPFYKNNKLKNNLSTIDINKGLEIWRGEKRILKLEINDIDDDDDDETRYILYYGVSEVADTCKFKVRLLQGYPLLDLLETSRRRISIADQSLLEGCYLLRPKKMRKYPLENNKLYFFPSKKIFQSDGISIKDNSGNAFDYRTDKTLFEIPVSNEDQFEIGIGKKQSSRFTIKKTSKNNYQYRFGFPKKYRLRSDLKEDTLYSLFVTSSERGVTLNNIEGGFYYPIFEEEENKNHIDASIHYYQQSSRDDLVLKVIDNNKSISNQVEYFYPNKEFKLYSEGKNGVKWIFQLNNLRASNAIKVSYLYYFVLVYLFIVFITCRIVEVEQMPPVEFLSYIIIFSFLVVRIILQWRMSTFPPVENISAFEYQLLTDSTHFLNTIYGVLLFFLVRWFYSSKGEGIRNNIYGKFADWEDSLSDKIYSSNNRVVAWCRNMYDRQDELSASFRLVYVWLLYAVILKLGLPVIEKVLPFSAERFINIGIPVFLYFLFDYRLKNSATEDSSISPYRTINSILTFLWLAVFDTGFSVIFVLFLLLSNALIYSVRLYQEGENELRSLLVFVFGFVAIFLILTESAPIFINGYNFVAENSKAILLGLGSIVVIGSAIILRQLRDTVNWINKIRFDILGPLLLIPIIFLIAQSQHNELSGLVKKFSYVKYRAEIHDTSLDNIIKNVKFDSGESNLALRAGQNQWFINTYIDINKMKGTSNSFFNLQDHFNRGSSYITQTTDLVVSRYLISEHSQKVVVLLLGLLLILVTGFTLEYDIYQESLSSIFKISVLLFTISYFIWLTATNRFIFFGQDFPLISLTSFFTVLFTLGLFLGLIILTDLKGEGNELEGNVFRKHVYPFIPIIFIAGIGVFIARADNDLNDKFDINQTMSNVNSAYQKVNQVFIDFQGKNKKEINSWELEEDQKIDSLAKLFYPQEEVKDIFEKYDDSLFIKSIYKHFIDSPNKRNLDDPIFLIKNEDGYFQFGVNRTYYLVQPPYKQQKRWRGSLLAAKFENGASFVNPKNSSKIKSIPNTLNESLKISSLVSNSHINVDLIVIPSDWFLGNRDFPKVILSVVGGAVNESEVKVRNNIHNSNFFNQHAESPAIGLLEDDIISLIPKSNSNSNSTGDHLLFRNNAREYLMKNIWLNGKSKKFYPLGEDFLWAYHYSNTIEKVYREIDNTHKDVNSTIDFELTKNVRKILTSKVEKNSDKEFGVVVLDEKGRIRLLADYKPKRELNPNDYEEVNDFRKESLLNVNRKTEREILGNLNLLRMKIGPGSSLKPITYAAVTSQAQFPWSSLIQVGKSFPDKYNNPKNNNHLIYYAGRPIQGSDSYKKYQEKSIEKNLGFEWNLDKSQYSRYDNHEYLIYSKNVYHSIINYLGSYNWIEISQLNQQLQSGDIGKSKIIKSNKSRIDFPVFSFGGEKTYAFNPDYFPPTNSKDENSFFGNEASLLGDGFSKNFGLPIYKDKRTRGSLKNIDSNSSKIFDNPLAKNSLYFSYPERSGFFQINRISSHQSGHVKGIVQSTLGGYPINVTPLKMAEMYGKLFSFNQNYKTSLEAFPQHKRMNLISSSGWDNNYFSFVKDNIYAPLKNVIKKGTGEFLNSEVNERLKDYKKQNKELHYYAKTGTISSAGDERRQSDKLLMVTICNKDLEKIAKSELDDVKFITIYFSGYKYKRKDWNLLTKELLKTIEESKTFKKHFNIK